MRRTKEDAEKTREEILKSAIRLFSEQGVSQTTLDKIAKDANVTRGAIYWHFANKMEIFDALFERLHTPFIAMIVDELNKNHPQPIQQLQDLCIRVLEDLPSDEEKRQSLKVFLFKADYTGELATYKQRHTMRKKEKLTVFAKYFQKAINQGTLSPDHDPDLLALGASCFMKGILFEYLDNEQDFDIQKMARPLITRFFKPMMADAPL